MSDQSNIRVFEIAEIKKLNNQLAASAQQDARDAGLKQLIADIESASVSPSNKLSCQTNYTRFKQGKWFAEQKHCRMIWEGLFFMFWHSDKSIYQRDTSIKIASIFGILGTNGWNEKQRLWLESFFYIFDKHWDKVDNFRIDKFMMLVRNMMNQVFTIFKSSNYEDINWFANFMDKFMRDPLRAQGIVLQIIDVLIPELGKVDNQISLENLSIILRPFLHLFATSQNTVVIERVEDNVLKPLLQSNVTPPDESEDSEPEDLTQVDGGKMSKSTRKEVNKLINTKYVFPNMNILLYAENYIFKVASGTIEEGNLREENREKVYNLYNLALKLEPQVKLELTFAQRMVVNKARSYITMKMRKRLEMKRAKSQKKALYKIKSMLSDKMLAQIAEIRAQSQIVQDELKESVEKPKAAKAPQTAYLMESDTGKTAPIKQYSEIQASNPEVSSTGSDEVITIKQNQSKKNKKRNKALKEVNQGESGRKRIKINLSENKVREFHMHSKVATSTLPSSQERSQSPLKSAIKQSSIDNYNKKRSIKGYQKVQF